VRYLILFALLVSGCATARPDVGLQTQAFSCKLPVYDVITKLGVLCQAIPTPPEQAWGQTLHEMKCSSPIYYASGAKVSTGIRYITVWSVWTEFSKSLSNQVWLHTKDSAGQPKKIVNTKGCDVVPPTWID
jgi:hypothetical protein